MVGYQVHMKKFRGNEEVRHGMERFQEATVPKVTGESSGNTLLWTEYLYSPYADIEVQTFGVAIFGDGLLQK